MLRLPYLNQINALISPLITLYYPITGFILTPTHSTHSLSASSPPTSAFNELSLLLFLGKVDPYKPFKPKTLK